MKKVFLSLLVMYGMVYGAQITQDHVDALDNSYLDTGNYKGQSFTATASEYLQSISVASDDAATVTLRIYNGETVCQTGGLVGASAASATPGAISETTGLSVPDTNPTGNDASSFYSTLTPNTPVMLTNGAQYTFCLEVTSGTLPLAFSTSDTYSDGVLMQNGVTFPSIDTAFRINVQQAAVSVPLFGPLGSMLLMTLMGLFAYRRLQA